MVSVSFRGVWPSMGKAVTHENLLRQRLRDLEGKQVLAIIASQSGRPQTGGGVVPLPDGVPKAVTASSRLAAL